MCLDRVQHYIVERSVTCLDSEHFFCFHITSHSLTLNLLTTTIIAPPNNASKWQMGFNSAFKGLKRIPPLSPSTFTFEKNMCCFIKVNSTEKRSPKL